MGERAVFVDAVRTPIGDYGGALRDVRPDDLAVHVIRGLLARNPAVEGTAIDDVVFGCTNQAGEDSRNVARMAVLLSGLPESVPGLTVNRLCASGLDAVVHAARMVTSGAGHCYIAGGTESMTRAPLIMGKAGGAFPRGVPEIHDSTIGWRFVNPGMARVHEPVGMGVTAENVAKKYGVTREDQDRLALESQQRWGSAHAAGRWSDELLSVEIPVRKGDPIRVERDEHPRPDTTMEKLAKLRPAFVEGGTVTAGNSSGINDGAAAVLVMSESRAAALGLRPIARFVDSTAAGVNADLMGIGPIPAVQKLLSRTGRSIGDVGLIELNEAFAAQALACVRELEIDPARCNVNGGAIAMGHPLGCTGARIVTTLLHEMRRRPSVELGLASLCVGVGQGVAMMVARI